MVNESIAAVADAIVARCEASYCYGETGVARAADVAQRFVEAPATLPPLVVELLRRHAAFVAGRGDDGSAKAGRRRVTHESLALWCQAAAGDLLRTYELAWTPGDAVALLDWFASRVDVDNSLAFLFPVGRLVKVVERACDGGFATPEMRPGLEAVRRCFVRPDKNQRRTLDLVDRLLGEQTSCPIKPGDPWADAAIAELATLKEKPRAAWDALLSHCVSGMGGEPPKTWLKAAPKLIDAVGRAEVIRRAAAWLPGLALDRAEGKPARGNVRNAEILRGLAWACGLIVGEEAKHATRDVAGALQAAAEAGYAKVPGSGRRNTKVGDGAVWALTKFPIYDAAARLGAIVDRCKNPLVTDHITPKLAEMATAAGVTQADLEEAALPEFGLVDGHRRDAIGECAVDVRVEGDEVTLSFVNDKGKPVKSPPAAVTRAYGDAIKRLKAEAKDATRLLAAARARLDGAWLPLRTWRFADVRSRYLTHGLIGGLARRLIWLVGDVAVTVDADGTARDVKGKPRKLNDGATTQLWHPIGRGVDEVVAWRERLAARGVTQPFKQAHREVYVLTDAERATAVYSNRFAGHIVRQAQVRAVAPQRGWRVGYFGGWDNSGAEMPTLDLPSLGLRVEWNLDMADAGGEATLPGGGVPFLATDFVAFYPRTTDDALRFGTTETSARLPLDRVDPLVFSEAMRHVDLFVAVASVGNDPNWQDAGTRFGAYWQRYTLGELNESARTRRDVLATLLPRLTKLKDKWTLAERHLVVRGTRRTYKIHLGSGNILMEPNDEYLCIVPDRRASADGVFLPFEGDAMLSVILSKAFLLADDQAIKDPTIVSQIGRK